MKKISIMIPCYNEVENIIPISEAVVKILEDQLPQYDYEVLFIDNCSNDGTRDKIETLVIQIIAILVLLVYLSVSFLTGAWHITWILWIVFIFVELIIKLIFSMKGEKENNEK